MKFNSDIDIDFANRDQILSLIGHVPASQIKNNNLSKHATGIYVTDVPVDPFTGYASIDYNEAEHRGYVKLDFLNVNLYNQVRDEAHLQGLMNQEPAWDRLYDRGFCEQLMHIGAHYDTLIKMPEAVNTIPRMAMFLAVIRPAKRHLIGKTWREVSETVWDPDANGAYAFKKSHSIAYSHLVVVNMNLLCEK
jgi:hypothetical protein